MKVAAYRTCGLVLARNMMYPIIIKGAAVIMTTPRLLIFMEMYGNCEK
jgi:hypothetical protein